MKYFIFPLLMVLYELPTYFSNDGYLPAVPTIIKDFSVSPSLVQMTITTWFIAPALLQLLLGPLADRFGKKPVLLIGGIVFIISSLVCATTNNIVILFIARFFQGATVASMTIAGYGTIHALFERKQAIRILTWMYSATLLGTAFGPLFGILILQFFHWRAIFMIIAVWVFFVITLLYFKMPETSEKKAIVQPQKIINSYLNILKNIQFTRATLTFCFLFAALIAWITVSPFLVLIEYHRTQLEFGVIQAFIFGSYILGAQFVNYLVNYYPVEYLSKQALCAAFIGGVLEIILPLIFNYSLFSFVLPMMLIIGTTGFCSPILNRISIESSLEPMGTRMAMFYMLVNLFGMGGSALVSLCYRGHSYHFALIVFACTLLSASSLKFYRNLSNISEYKIC